MPPTTPNWLLKNGVLTATPDHLQTSANWTADHAQSETKIRFTFAPPSTAPPLHLHASRLHWAGGPFAAILSHNFRERSNESVNLCPDDDPLTFALIRDFIYCRQIALKGRPLPHLFRVLNSAHRWELTDLVSLVSLHIVEADALACATDVIHAFQSVALLHDLPPSFLRYFWASLATFFDHFRHEPTPYDYPRGDDAIDLPSNVGQPADTPSTDTLTERESALRHVQAITNSICPAFPDIWDVAIAQGVLFQLFRDILAHTTHSLTMQLLDVLMLYAEPLIEQDERLLDAITLLVRKCDSYTKLLGHATIRNASSRAIRLFAIALERKNDDPEVGFRAIWTYSMWDKSYPPRTHTFEHPLDRHRCDDDCKSDPKCPVAAAGLDLEIPLENMSGAQFRALRDCIDEHGHFGSFTMNGRRAAHLYRLKEKDFVKPVPARAEVRVYQSWNKDKEGMMHLKCKVEFSFGHHVPFEGNKWMFHISHMECDCECSVDGKKKVLFSHEEEVTATSKKFGSISLEVPSKEVLNYFDRHDKSNSCKMKTRISLEFLS